MEKKCSNCSNRNFCAMYKNIIAIAGLLNANIKRDISGKLPFVFITDAMAHDCMRFQKIEGGN